MTHHDGQRRQPLIHCLFHFLPPLPLCQPVTAKDPSPLPALHSETPLMTDAYRSTSVSVLTPSLYPKHGHASSAFWFRLRRVGIKKRRKRLVVEKKEAGHYSGLNENWRSKTFDAHRSLSLQHSPALLRPTTKPEYHIPGAWLVTRCGYIRWGHGLSPASIHRQKLLALTKQ